MSTTPIPSPALKRLSAAALLDEIQARGGRIYRTRTWPAGEEDRPPVFVLTDNTDLAAWLRQQGATPATHAEDDGSYQRAGGKREFDLYVHLIPLEGDLTLAELL